MRSAQQESAVQAVLDAVRSGAGRCILLDAVAGAGKTHTLLEMVQAVRTQRPQARILCLAFNLEMARQLRERLGLVGEDRHGPLEVYTLHAYGMRLCEEHPPPPDDDDDDNAPLPPPPKRPRQRRAVTVDPDKAYRTWRRQVGPGPSPHAWASVRAVVDRLRQEGEEEEGEDEAVAWAVVRAMVAERRVVDLEDQIYHPVVHRLALRPDEQYDLVLVDESQDLNRATHRFLRECVVPVGARTVLCAVGDPMQAIYAFRGADPDSMERLAETFGGGGGAVQRLRLTWCFRCPRRILFLASQISAVIRPAPGAPRGRVRVITTDTPFETVLQLHAAAAGDDGPTVLLARGNAVLLDFLAHVYAQVGGGGAAAAAPPLRWVSPGVQRTVEAAREESPPGCTLGGCLARLRAAVQVDRTMVRIVSTAARLDGPATPVDRSRWLAWLGDALRPAPTGGGGGAALVVATVHAVKGQEYRHVILYEYNLFGHQMMDTDHPQEQNLLYIALTRSTETLTLLMHRRTRAVVSPFLPIEMVHYSTELWREETEKREGV